MKNFMVLISIVTATFLYSGCLRYTYSVANVVPEIGSTGNGVVAVASQDQRSYIVSGRNQPQLVGVVRGAFGNPLYMNTDTGRPLADEMGEVIAGALKRQGYETLSIPISPDEPVPQVLEKLMDTVAAKLIHFQINGWKSDTYNRIRLEYLLSLSVFDQTGQLLAEKQVSGDENLGGGGFNIVRGTRKKVPVAFKAIMENLFNAPEIRNALEQ
jgi:hypothetical protein